jgi:tetratricopeptide (TPR) repeat protein
MQMAAQTINQNTVAPLSGADVVSDAAITPEASRFIREVLECAVTNQTASGSSWLTEAWALLANVLANDYLNSWNGAGKKVLEEAENALKNSDPELPLAQHAQGLIHRAHGMHQEALTAFQGATQGDAKFARAHAQLGNQFVLTGETAKARRSVRRAIRLRPRHPAVGYFYWIMGRAYFFDQKYGQAITWLGRSVGVLTSVWYNRLYLVAAYALSDQMNDAQRQFEEFNSLFEGYTLDRVKANEKASPNADETVVAGRQRLLEGLRKVKMPES